MKATDLGPLFSDGPMQTIDHGLLLGNGPLQFEDHGYQHWPCHIIIVTSILMPT
jgi:hypothetical protein